MNTKKLTLRHVAIALMVALSATAAGNALAKGEKEHGDKPVMEKIVKEFGEFAAGAGGAISAGIGVFLTPSQISKEQDLHH